MSAGGYVVNAACPDSPIVGIGFQNGERWGNVLRIIGVMFMMSFATRMDLRFIKRYPLIYFNWSMGLTLMVLQLLMSIMVLNCWADEETKKFIYVLKFLELLVSSLVPLSSLCILMELDSRVHFQNTQLVRMFAHRVTISLSVIVAVVVAIASAVYWNMLLMTGGQFVAFNFEDADIARWVMNSYVIVGGFIAPLMLGLVLDLVFRRREALKECLRDVVVVRPHLMMSVVATIVALCTGTFSLVDEIEQSEATNELFAVAMTLRFTQISVNAQIVLYYLPGLEAVAHPDTRHRGSASAGTKALLSATGDGKQSASVVPEPVEKA